LITGGVDERKSERWWHKASAEELRGGVQACGR